MKQQKVNISRREFLIHTGLAGAGFALGMQLPLGNQALAAVADAKSPQVAPEVNAWVVIEPDDTVIIRIARSEMGQGTLTGLAQLVAEELECDWSKVTTEYPSPAQSLARDRVWGSFATGGSRGIRTSHDYVRKGGAVAREMLIQAAADEWGVPADECSAENSVITHNPSGRTTTYGSVATAAAKLEPPFDVLLKDPEDWKIAGKPVKRLDTADKVTGKQIYSADLQLPGMLNAAIKACPVFGGTVKSFDAGAIRKRPGVRKVVQVGDNAVAVVADTWWHAKTALDALPIQWNEGPNAKLDSATIDTMLADGIDSSDDVFIGNQAGDVKAALEGATKTVVATYRYPYQAHACMEPMNATARWTEQRCEVWCPTQNGETALQDTAEAAGLPAEQCEVYKLHLGGGFGRRSIHDYITQAVTIAKQLPGTPVKLLWSREEDIQHDHYHPVTRCKLTGALDANGNLAGLQVRISGHSIFAVRSPQMVQAWNGADMITFQGFVDKDMLGGDHSIGYTIPNLQVEHAMRNPPVPPGAWRAVNAHQNAIYLECFIDELAHAAGKDPLAFRQTLMAKHPKNLAVLNAVAEKVGWSKPPPAGVHRGLAVFKSFGSYTAACAEIKVDDGKLTIQRIVAATDPGHAVNPQQIEAQVEGSIVYGLSALLYGEITVKDGRIEQGNFDSYPMLLINEMPRVDVILMPSGDFWGGVGEPTTVIAAPAVLNAIYAATGKRIREVPLKNTDLRPA
jgi:isoquinoline 1-oxidoreductase beta subunit